MKFIKHSENCIKWVLIILIIFTLVCNVKQYLTIQSCKNELRANTYGQPLRSIIKISDKLLKKLYSNKYNYYDIVHSQEELGILAPYFSDTPIQNYGPAIIGVADSCSDLANAIEKHEVKLINNNRIKTIDKLNLIINFYNMLINYNQKSISKAKGNELKIDNIIYNSIEQDPKCQKLIKDYFYKLQQHYNEFYKSENIYFDL